MDTCIYFLCSPFIHSHLHLISCHSLVSWPGFPQHVVLSLPSPTSWLLSCLTADWLYCWLGGTKSQISRQLEVYWQLSRTDGHWVGECEWLLVKGLADWGLHQPINQTCLASSAEAFIMNPRGRGESLFVGRLLTTNRLNCKKWNSEGHAHMSGMTSSHQSLSWTPWPSQLLRSTERM